MIKHYREINQSQKLMIFVLSMSLFGLATMFSELVPSVYIGVVELSIEYFLFIPLSLAMFPGMEIDIKEKGHILVLGSIEEFLELNQELSPNKKVSDFLPFSDLLKILKNYNLILGAAHPFRPGGNIPNLKENEIKEFDFIDLNGKDMVNNKDYAINNTRKLSNTYNIPVVAGSDTHQALQYGCTWTNFEEDINTFSKLKREIELENYKIQVSQSINSQVKSAGLLKKALKEIHSLGGDYVQILLQE